MQFTRCDKKPEIKKNLAGFVSIKIECIIWTTVLMMQYVVYDADKYSH